MSIKIADLEEIVLRPDFSNIPLVSLIGSP